jgi:hypothetical protein
MKLSLCFQGYVTVDTDDVPFADGSGIIRQVHHLMPAELESELRRGKLKVFLSEILPNTIKEEVELFDYEVEN